MVDNTATFFRKMYAKDPACLESVTHPDFYNRLNHQVTILTAKDDEVRPEQVACFELSFGYPQSGVCK